MGRQNDGIYIPTEDEDKLFQEYLKDPPQIWVPERSKVKSPPNKFTIDNLFSPRNFAEFIGQAEAKELAHIMVQAALNERRSLPNIMIVGEYGLGKTSLARLIMRAAQIEERLYDGVSINREFPETGTFIIDEIHNLEPQTADSLNIQLDSGKFTIIGCTNNPGLLPSAFRSRFRTVQLKHYTSKDLKIIARKICQRKGVTYTDHALVLLASRSRFNARQVIMYLSLIFDIMSVHKLHTISAQVVRDAFNRIGVDNKGLLPRDREYLNALPKNRPVGLQYLSAVLGIDEKTIEEEVEPFLLRTGHIDRTPRGRVKIEGF